MVDGELATQKFHVSDTSNIRNNKGKKIIRYKDNSYGNIFFFNELRTIIGTLFPGREKIYLCIKYTYNKE